MSESSATTEMMISLPEALVAELDGVAMREKRSRNEL
ncbi:antitoxin endoai, partial [Bacillus atrophaeus]|nr:antitoxin endoai [Bacillus atrophaeus]